VLNLITQRYLAPVHGALLEKHGAGVLLCGESGAGKSTLAFACARRGWRYVTDDACSLVRNRSDRFGIGNPHSIRFREDVASHFPELTSRIPQMRVSGKIGIEIFTREMPDMQISTGSRIDNVVFLNRAAPGTPALKRFSKLEALDRFARCVSTGDDQVRAEQLQTYERLLEAEFWELRYRDLDDAVAILDGLVPQNAVEF
jgi:predicted ATPase